MRKFLLFTTVLTLATSQVWAGDKDVPTNVQRKYDRRLEEMKTLDKNKDGLLQAEELQQGAVGKFDAADLNKDGVISPEERQAILNNFRDTQKEAAKNTQKSRTNRLEGRYKNADTNKDGQVSKQEYDAYFGTRYQNFDRDGDGVITEKEYRTDAEKLPARYKKKNK